MTFVFCERTGIATPHARGSNPKNTSIIYEIYHTLPWWLNTVRGKMYQTEWPITIQKIPCITARAECHGSTYQSGRLPSKTYRALPWGLSITVEDVPEWPITIQKIPCITVGAEYHRSMYQSGRLPSKKYRALPWCLSTAVNITNLNNRYKEELSMQLTIAPPLPAPVFRTAIAHTSTWRAQILKGCQTFDRHHVRLTGTRLDTRSL